MQLRHVVIGLLAVACSAAVAAQNPPVGTPPATAAPAGPRGGGGGRGGRGNVQVMTLTTSAWMDGAEIPAKYAQPGDEVSPPLSWTGAPDGTLSFVLIAHDLDSGAGAANDDLLQWMVWNIPGASKALPEGLPQGPQLTDGSRQISVTGPYYRGPAAPASGPVHHYVFELFALDALLDVPPVGAAPAATRAAVVTAMTGHVKGKAVLTGRFRRAP